MAARQSQSRKAWGTIRRGGRSPVEVGLVGDLVLQSLAQSPPGSLPLKLRIYAGLRQAILDNHLTAGTRLPATRNLATDLGVGRNTILRAYEQLYAEGYVAGQVGAGTFVADTLPDAPLRGHRRRCAATHAATPTLSRRGAEIAAYASSSKLQYGAFMPGIPDVDLFPFETWRKLFNKYMRREHSRLLHYAAGGYGPLKAALCAYLKATRFIDCEPRQILILNGSHQALDLCARLLADEGDRAWIEDPGYWGARNVLRAAGLRLVPIPVDEHGLAPDEAAWANAPRLVFVSPSCQYPTGAVLSLARRRSLLERAAQCGAWIIEDDYDNELRYHRNPVAPLFGLARSQRVVYLGTFSKVMFPGLRLAYLVVPPAMVEPLAIGNAELYREGRLVEQAALAEFIAEGYFASHIRRMRVVYAERQAVLRSSLARTLGGAVTACGGQAGIHLLYRFHQPVDDTGIARDALAAGVIVRPLSLYCHDARHQRPGVMLGYAGVATEAIEPAAERLALAIEPHLAAPR